ncbi:hypothetical protein PoB_007309800, partial [Plakobranchus ocellatus]
MWSASGQKNRKLVVLDATKKEWESPDFEKERYAGQIKPSSAGPTHTFCIPCRKSIKVTASGVYDLCAHFDTQAHKKCVEKSKTYRSMDEHFQPAAAVKPTPSNATEVEVMFCHFVAEHNLAPFVADHFMDLVKKMFPQCTVAKEFASRQPSLTVITNSSSFLYSDEYLVVGEDFVTFELDLSGNNSDYTYEFFDAPSFKFHTSKIEGWKITQDHEYPNKTHRTRRRQALAVAGVYGGASASPSSSSSPSSPFPSRHIILDMWTSVAITGS